MLNLILVLENYFITLQRMLVYPYIQEHDNYWGLLPKILILVTISFMNSIIGEI